MKFVYGGWNLLKRDESVAKSDNNLLERKYFKYSLSYLFLHFLALVIQSVWIKLGMEAWF